MSRCAMKRGLGLDDSDWTPKSKITTEFFFF